MAAASTLARIAKIGNDKIGFSSAVLRNGRFDEFRNNLEQARLVFRPEDAKRLLAQSDDGAAGRRLPKKRFSRMEREGLMKFRKMERVLTAHRKRHHHLRQTFGTRKPAFYEGF